MIAADRGGWSPTILEKRGVDKILTVLSPKAADYQYHLASSVADKFIASEIGNLQNWIFNLVWALAIPYSCAEFSSHAIL